MDGPINKDLTNTVLANQYRLTKKLGAGAFGEIYHAINKSNKDEVAIKLEPKNCQFPQVFFEAKLYHYLNSDNYPERVLPQVYGANTEGEYNYMIMELLGKSLEDLLYQQNRKFSLKTVVMLGEQMVSRLEFIHERQFIHRDVKPDNFLMGNGRKGSKVYLVDLGLAKRYITKEGHIPYKENKALTGTVRYASVNTHLGIEQSRRDDLESLAYVLAYLIKGQLPWMNIKINNQREKYEKILQKKMQTSAELLFQGQPSELAQYMNYCKQLKFEEKPDYKLMRGFFKVKIKQIMGQQDIAQKQNIQMDYRYDWTKQIDKIEVLEEVQTKQNKPLNQEKIKIEQKLHNQNLTVKNPNQNKVNEKERLQNILMKSNTIPNKDQNNNLEKQIPKQEPFNQIGKEAAKQIPNERQNQIQKFPIAAQIIPKRASNDWLKNPPQTAIPQRRASDRQGLKVKNPIESARIRQQSAKPLQTQIIQPPRIVINKEPYQKY